MKLLIFAVFCFISSAAFAQITNEDVLKRLERIDLNYLKKIKDGNRLLKPQVSITDIKKPESFLKQQPGVYSLEDGMPCIVPDTNSLAAIPNAFPNVSVPFKPSIPNAAPLMPLLDPNRNWSK